MTDNYLRHLDQKSVLVMNFNSSVSTQMLLLLDNFNFNSNMATNKRQFVNYTQAKQFDLIIFFIENKNSKDLLPLVTEIRNQRTTFKIPIVIISTIIEPDWVNAIIAAGVTEYIVPPLNLAILARRFQHAIDYPIRNNNNIDMVVPAKTRKTKNTVEDLCVLIVDDIGENIEIITGVIRKSYQVKAAKSASSAMKVCLSNSPPDLVLLDIMMPDIDGLTFCQQLSMNPLTQDIKVIFISALTATDDVVRGLKLGAVDYIPKPIIPEILLARIEVHGKLILQHQALQAQIDTIIGNQTKD